MRTGVDILAVSRLRPLMPLPGDPFWQKVYSARELQEAAERSDPLSYLAGRWAAKEAVMKTLPSLGAGPDGPLRENQIEILTGEDGAPLLFLQGKRRNISVSISHEEEYAIAFAVNYEDEMQ